MLPPRFARPPADPTEERRIRRLASARHAPASWLQRARIVTLSWDGAQVGQIAAQLGCQPRTVYRWLHRFNAGGIDGLGDLPRSGRPRRLGELERGQLIALARSQPPGRLQLAPDGTSGWPSRSRGGALDPGCPGPRRPGARDHGRAQPGLPGPGGRGGALATGAVLEHQRRPGLRPYRATIIALYTAPPEQMTVICADELGPVIPRTFPPPPGWSTDGYRIKAPRVYDRGAWKTWVYGALRPGDGQAITVTAPSRDSVGYQQLLAAVEAANPTGEIAVITDNLPSHSSFSTRTWLAGHLRIRQVFIPVGTCWLNLQEAWWPSFSAPPWPGRASPAPTRSPWPPESRPASRVPTLGRGWGRSSPSPRYRRPVLTYAFEERSISPTLGGCWSVSDSSVNC